MRLAVIGPGAIGCLFAARFVRAGYETWLLDKEPSRAAVLLRDGISVASAGEAAWSVQVKATSDAHAIPEPDFICLCVKSYDTASAIQHAAELMSGKPVVSLQNGIGNLDEVMWLVPDALPICAATGQGAIVESVGKITHTGFGDTRIAPFAAFAAPAAQQFGELLRTAGFEVQMHNNAASVLWGKLVVNAALNPASAIWRLKNGEVPTHAGAGPAAKAAAHETMETAQRLGIDLSFRDPWKVLCEVCEATSGNRSSMYEDVLHRRRTEIDAINGAVVSAARNVGLDVPANKDFVRRIRELEAGYRAS